MNIEEQIKEQIKETTDYMCELAQKHYEFGDITFGDMAKEMNKELTNLLQAEKEQYLLRERWELLLDYPNYEVSSHGRVRNQDGKKMKQTITAMGYNRVGLTTNWKQKDFQVHRLVAMYFIPNPLNKEQVNHKNLDKNNNRVENLEWVTDMENRQHAKENGAWDTPKVKRHMKKARASFIEKSRREVVQLTKDGEFVAKHYSIKEAGRTTGINYKNIHSAVVGRYQSAGGYKWADVEQFMKESV